MITLTITKAPFEHSQQQKSIIVGPQGGAIGRSEEKNIFIISDPNVSRHHCQILFIEGKYCVKDTSVNGVFINNAPTAVGMGCVAPIKDGDLIRIGQTEMRVTNYAPNARELYELDPLIEPKNASTVINTNKTPVAKKKNLEDGWFDSHQSLPEHASMVSLPLQGDVLSKLLEEAKSADVAYITPKSDHLSDLVGDKKAGQIVSDIEVIDELAIEPELNLGSIIPNDFDPLVALAPIGKVSNIDSNHKQENSVVKLEHGARHGNHNSPAIPVGNDTFFAMLRGESVAEALNSHKNFDQSMSNSSSFRGEVEAAVLEKKISRASPQAEQSVSVSVAESKSGSAELRKVSSFTENSDLAALKAAISPLLGEHVESLSEEQCLRIVSDMATALSDTISGLMDSLQSRWAFKQSLRLNVTIVQRAENNPLKFSPTPEAAAEIMFLHRPRGYLEASAAFKDGIRELQLHQAALVNAIKPALLDTMTEYFSADTVKRVENKKRQSDFLTFNKRAKLWDCYEEYSRRLLIKDQCELEQHFMKKFRESYAGFSGDPVESREW